MSTFAADTSVSVEKSRAEVERTLARYGATAFGYMTEPGRAVIMFEAHGRRILVRYRYTHRGTDQPPIVNLLAWEATTKANENATHGNEIRQRLTQGTDAASAVAGIIDPAEARRIARDLGLRVEFDERPLPDPDCADCAGSGWRTVEEGSTRVEPCPCTASNVTPLRRTS